MGRRADPTLLVAAAVATLLPLLALEAARAGELTFHAASGGQFALADLVPRLRSARFVLIGEEHGSYRHHDVQIRVMSALRDAGVPVAAGLEAFPPAATPALRRWTAGQLESDALYRLFDASWSLKNWPAYRDLLFFLREGGVPCAGIDADDALIRRVVLAGRSSLTPEEQRSLPPGGCAADERYRAVLRLLLDGEKHESSFVNFCEAQSLRDAVLARELGALAAAHPGHVVAGLIGLYHAWKPAVPARLGELGLGPVVVILPEELLPRTAADLAPEADYLWRWRD